MRDTLRAPRRAFLVASLAVAVVVVAAVAASVTAGAAKAGGFAPVSQGTGAAALSGYTPFDPTAPNTPERVTFVLKARNVDQLKGMVSAGMPGGFMSVSDFARAYGQPSIVIGLIRAYLGSFGIQSQAMPNNLVIQTTGTAGQYNNAFQIVQQNFRIPSAPSHDGHPGHGPMVVHGSTRDPVVPTALSHVILSILGLSNYPTQQSESIGLADGQQAAPSSAPPYLPSDFASQYNLTPVQHAGGTGAGRTIGIVTLASVKPDVVAQFWSGLAGLSGAQASAGRITPVNVDGGAGTASDAVGSDETALDVEQSGALAPDAKVRVYQAPNTDAGFVDGFFQAASENSADTVSASWGSSETILKVLEDIGAQDVNYAASFDEAFLELAAQGQSTFLSSGDSGAYPASRDLGSTDRSAGNPDDSPWVTSSGGTTLPGLLNVHGTMINIPAERTWGWDYLWGPRSAANGVPEIAYAESHVVGGGGGYSSIEPMPDYQRQVHADAFSAVEYLTPIAFSSDFGGDPNSGLSFSFQLPWDWAFNPAPATTTGHSQGRATPDLAANADPETGYALLYTFGDSADPNAPPSVEQFGGTSFVAPQLNGAAAVIDSALGRRVGLWNPAIYRFATQRNSPFTPLGVSGTSNDNLYYTGTPGALYNAGSSGLGTPDLAKLAADFAASTSHH
jgi:subtilase family serine protease